jgi:hypothetical protein
MKSYSTDIAADIFNIVYPSIPEEEWRKTSQSVEMKFSRTLIITFRLEEMTSESN